MRIVSERKLFSAERQALPLPKQGGKAAVATSERRLLPVSKLTVVCWIATFAFAALVAHRPALAADEVRPAALEQVSPSQPNCPNVIVVGFVGGFVSRTDSRHPEVQLIRELQERYPGAYFAVFDNHHVKQAHKEIQEKLHLKDARRVVCPEIVLFGHSWGASAVVRLARLLDHDGIPVALTVQVDSVAKPFSDDRVIPANVAQAVNFYQTHGLIHGQPEIKAADPLHTEILGNFRREYKTQPAPCRSFPWYSRRFTKGHIAIECDPELWVQLKALMLAHMPDESLAHDVPAMSASRREISKTETRVEFISANENQINRREAN